MKYGWYFYVLSIYEKKMEVYVNNEMKRRNDNDLQFKFNEIYKFELYGL